MLTRRRYVQVALAGVACCLADSVLLAQTKPKKALVKRLSIAESRHIDMVSDALPDALDTYLYQDGSNYCLEGVDLVLTQNLIPGTGNLLVRADTVTIPSTIALPGRTLTILARTITFAAGAKIVADGSPPDPTHDFTNQKAGDGASAGDRGGDGGSGGPGHDAGSIALYASSYVGVATMSANGGRGGDAESGGNGAPGRPGATAQPGMSRGGDGGPGGPAGKPGTPGGGGNAGAISLWVLNPSTPVPLISATVNQGPRGTPHPRQTTSVPG